MLGCACFVLEGQVRGWVFHMWLLRDRATPRGMAGLRTYDPILLDVMPPAKDITSLRACGGDIYRKDKSLPVAADVPEIAAERARQLEQQLGRGGCERRRGRDIHRHHEKLVGLEVLARGKTFLFRPPANAAWPDTPSFDTRHFASPGCPLDAHRRTERRLRLVLAGPHRIGTP